MNPEALERLTKDTVTKPSDMLRHYTSDIYSIYESKDQYRHKVATHLYFRLLDDIYTKLDHPTSEVTVIELSNQDVVEILKTQAGAISLYHNKQSGDSTKWDRLVEIFTELTEHCNRVLHGRAVITIGVSNQHRRIALILDL